MLLDLFKKNSYKKYFLNIFITSLSILSSVYVLLNNTDESYNLLFLMPITYAFSFLFVLSKVTFNKFRIFYTVFTIITFFRYVVYPFGTIYVGLYSGRSPEQPAKESFELAILLVVYELIIVTIFLLFLSRNKKKRDSLKFLPKQYENNIKLPNNKFIYFLFIFITFILVLIFPNTINNFNFIIPKNISNNAVELTTIESLVAIFISVTKQILFLLLMSSAYKKYIHHKSSKYIFISLFLVFINMSIYSGLNRSDFIMMAIASTYLFGTLYPKYIMRVIILLIVILLIVIPSITTVRQMTGIIGNNQFMYSLTQTMQQYLGSPYNVAIAIEAKYKYIEHTHFFNLLYDFLRPTFGINMLVKNLPLNFSNEFFNYRMYLDDRIIQIIPMIGEGYFYFGFLFSPLITILFLWLGDYLSRVHLNSRSIELKYFLTITCARLGFIMGQNASIQMNDLSFTLFVPLTLYWINKKIVINKNKMVVK